MPGSIFAAATVEAVDNGIYPRAVVTFEEDSEVRFALVISDRIVADDLFSTLPSARFVLAVVAFVRSDKLLAFASSVDGLMPPRA